MSRPTRAGHPHAGYQFTRFLRYADRHQLTYSDTIAHLLDSAGAGIMPA